MSKVYIAGVYRGDENYVIGAFTDKEQASFAGSMMVSSFFEHDLCSYTKPLIIDEFDHEIAADNLATAMGGQTNE